MSKLDLGTRRTPADKRSEQVQWLNLQLAIAARRAHACQRLPKQPRVNVDSKMAAVALELAKQVAAEYPSEKLDLADVFEEDDAALAAESTLWRAGPKTRITIAPVDALPQPAAPQELGYGGESDWFEVQAAPDDYMEDGDGDAGYSF